MADLIVKKPIRRLFDSGEIKELDDEVIAEFRLHMHLDGEPFLQATLSPYLVKEFVVGFLRTRSLVQAMEDIASLEIEGEEAIIVRSPRLHGRVPKLNLLESTGSRNVGPEEVLFPKSPVSALCVTAGTIIRGVHMLSEMPLYLRTGGTHCAILFSPAGDVLSSAEDIGRHNAVDKVIGSALIKGTDFSNTWLAVSGRLPADMVLKPALLGIPLVASVSAPTTEGIEMGERSGVSVVGFTRGGRLNCYSYPGRISQNTC
ncbi:MAG: formate dehydrogenase accessory sulfurtransferase FdhD [Desulfobacteraceae bacterium]|nr:MAG: formate dehydrogenase accessory sulfurtransferase FdhD [Desulfobacteraceae bacterium]